MILKSVFRMMSPSGTHGRLSVLIFHRVVSFPDPLFPSEIDTVCFDNICRWVKSWGNVLPLDEAISRLNSRSLPASAVSITFDDGYADNYTQAVPILKRHGLTATFFIATNFLDGGRMWNDTIIEAVRGCEEPLLNLESSAGYRSMKLNQIPTFTIVEKQVAINNIINKIKYLPPTEREDLAHQLADISGVSLPIDLMMTSLQVKQMRQMGMQIGAHTLSHPILACLNRIEAFKEIASSKEFLEGILGEPIRLFAYPNGKPSIDYNRETVEIARELGFDGAVATAWGAANSETDPYQIPRFTPWEKRKWRFATQLLVNLNRPLSTL